MEKIYAAPINAGYYAVFVGDKKLTLPLSEADAKKIADRYNGFEELEQENKRLAMQVEVLSADFENNAPDFGTMKISEIEIEDFASENTPDSPTWQGAVLGATWANEKLAAHIAELEKENKRLALQNEVFRAALEEADGKLNDALGEYNGVRIEWLPESLWPTKEAQIIVSEALNPA